MAASRAARYEGHVGTALGEPRTEIAANAARPHHGNFHAHSPEISDWRIALGGAAIAFFRAVAGCRVAAKAASRALPACGSRLDSIDALNYMIVLIISASRRGGAAPRFRTFRKAFAGNRRTARACASQGVAAAPRQCVCLARDFKIVSGPPLRKIFRFLICHLAHIRAMCDCLISNY
jgi:hypothetical protein